MSGECIYGAFGQEASQGGPAQKQLSKSQSPYTGQYEKRLADPQKPSYSTFFQQGKEYDGTNVRFFKQRDAVIGKGVSDEVDPRNFLKKGGGVTYVVPPVREEKMYSKAPLDMNSRRSPGYGAGADGAGASSIVGYDENGVPITRGNDTADGMSYDDQGNPVRGADNVGTVSGAGTGKAGSKNYVESNIIEASNMVPKRRKEQQPLPTDRKSFGQAPAYLSRVKSEVTQEKSIVKAIEHTRQQRSELAYAKYVYLLPQEEHESLVTKLKARLEESVMELQKMPFSKDNISVRKRKAELDRIITDAENALRKLEKEAIFIYKDDPVNAEWAKEAAMKEAQKYASGLA